MMNKKELCLAIIQQFELQNPTVDVHDKNYDQNFIFRDAKLAMCWGYMNKIDPNNYPINQDYLLSYANSKSRNVTLFGYMDPNNKFHELTFKELLDMLPEE